MKYRAIILFLIFSFSIYALSVEINPINAAKTGSYNFCKQFPAFPECVGWRIDAIDDNYWFCEYVHLKELCNNMPNPEKTIPLKTQNDCCQYIGPRLEKLNPINPEENLQIKEPILKDKLESILPLTIWTDKDHYNFRDKTIVYGKFDFTNPSIIQNIKGKDFAQTGEVTEKTFTVDIKLNGKQVLQEIPVSPNGWFSASFNHNNIYNFATQNNLLEVEYIITQGKIPLGGPRTHATYQFTTGDIAKIDENFEVWIDKSSLPTKIQFGVIVKNPERFNELMRYDLITTRLTTPDGFVIPVDVSYSIKDLSAEYSEFLKYGNGTYEIQVSYGNNVSKGTFEYQIP